MDEKDFALRLSVLRTKAGVSARDMSLSIGQNPGYINDIENGKGTPSLAGIFYICGGNGEGDLCSLPADKMNHYEKMFYEPEEFQKKEVQAKCILRFISID